MISHQTGRLLFQIAFTVYMVAVMGVSVTAWVKGYATRLWAVLLIAFELALVIQVWRLP